MAHIRKVYSAVDNQIALGHIGLHPKSGHMYQCPYHKDKTPSLSIDIQKGIYFCFSCKRSGTISGLVYDRSSDKVSMESLLNRDPFMSAGGAHNLVTYNHEVILPKEVPLTIRGIISIYDTSPQAQEYIRLRFIPENVAKEMGVGFADEVYVNETRMLSRVTFPIYNAEGILINLEARDSTRKNKVKCLYPKNSLKPLYEWYKLDKSKPLYIVEGLIKLLVLRTDPKFENSSTVFGSYISDYQKSHLDQFEGRIVVIPDNDDAGQTLVRKLKELYGERVGVMNIVDPEIKDIDDIPRLTGMTVQQYRESGRLVEQFF